MNIVLFTVAFLCIFYPAILCSKTEVHVHVPSLVRRGSTITLSCHHNLTSDNLYSVKWYRGNYEFYRYVPRERPPIATFPLPGLEVDTNGSSGQQVTVRVLERYISGRFTCEVSAEEPSFSTGSASGHLSVTDIGVRRPLVQPASSVHVAGTPLEVNCSAEPTVPRPDIAFYIDNIKADEGLVTALRPGLSSLRVLQLSPQDGPHWVSCEASVPGVYHLASASIPVLEQLPSPESASGLVIEPSVSRYVLLNVILVLWVSAK